MIGIKQYRLKKKLKWNQIKLYKNFNKSLISKNSQKTINK